MVKDDYKENISKKEHDSNLLVNDEILSSSTNCAELVHVNETPEEIYLESVK